MESPLTPQTPRVPESDNTVSAPSRLTELSLCALSCLSALYLSTVSQYALFDLLGILSLILFAGAYSLLLDASGLFTRVLPPVLAAAAMILQAVFSGSWSFISSQRLLQLLFALFCAAALYFCACGKAAKSVTFAATTTVLTVFTAAQAAVLIFQHYGALSLSVCKTAVFESTQAFGSFYTALLAAAAGGLDANAGGGADFTAFLDEFEEMFVSSVRASLPSLAVSYCMLIAVLTLAVYKLLVRLSHAEERCLAGRQWGFSLSGVSVFFFYISFAVYFVSSLFSNQTAFCAAFMNVTAILTYPFAWLGIKFLYHILYTKLHSRAGSAALIAVAFFILGGLFGAASVLFTLLAFVGASAQLSALFRPSKPSA